MNKIWLFLMILTGAMLVACSEKEKDNDTFFQTAPVTVDKIKMLQLVNEVRSSAAFCGSPAPPLVWNDTLALVAKRHSEDMNANRKLSHSSADGSLVDARLTKAGYLWSDYAENLLKGGATEEEAVQAWLKSTAHCSNIMRPTVKEIGVGTSGVYWTMVLASH